MKSLYLQLDWLIPQFIEEYIPLNEKQEQELRLRLQKTILWHRNTQLPQYVNWLRTFQKEIQQGLSETQALQHTKQLEAYGKTLLVYLADDTAEVLFSTNKEQREHLFKTFERKNEDFQQKYVKPNNDEIRNNLLMQINDGYERWIGHIEPAQKLLMQEASIKLKPTGALNLKNRLVLQNKLRTILDTATTVTQLRSELKNLFSHWEKLRSREYEQTLEYNQSVLLKLTSEISMTLSMEQKIYLNEKIDSYIKLFSELSINNT